MQKFKKFFTHFLVVLLALQGTVAALTVNATRALAASQDVVINEIMWMGSYEGTTSHATDEWVELYNTTANPISLSGWQLTSINLPAFPVNSVIPANGYYLVSHFDKTSGSSVLNVTPDWVNSSISLANAPACATIDLVRADSVVTDTMACNTNGSYFAGLNDTTNRIRRSMERKLVLLNGALVASWQDSIGFANLDSSAEGGTLATPKFANDTTKPTNGTVTDDGQFTANTAEIHATWSGFADAESGIQTYNIGVGTAPGVSDVQFVQNAGLVAEYTFTGLSLNDDATYYVNVIAINGVGLEGLYAAGDGITVNTVNPNTPANLTVTDLPGDSGGSLKAAWDVSSSPDVTSYQVNYRRQGDTAWAAIDAGLATEQIVSGLLNAPVTYEFTVEAVDFNDQHSVVSSVVTGQAQDNLPPVINGASLTLNQNAPGSTDTVQGAAGVSTEAGLANVYSVDPLANPTALPVGSMPLSSDRSFLPISIGDNLYGAVWVRVADAAGNLSQAVKLANDIVAPNAPTLTKIDATCPDACQVKLIWNDNGPDTLSYQVGYTATNGIEQRSLKVTTTEATLTLDAGTGYDFVIYAFDGAGNVSTKSNALHAQLTSGVQTVVTLVNGLPVTTTSALSGAKEVVPAKKSSFFGATRVQADEPTATPSGSSSTAPGANSANNATNRSQGESWAKVLIIAALLLVIAGGFYFLSRSYDDASEESPTQAKPAAKAAGTAKTASRRRSTRRRKRKSS